MMNKLVGICLCVIVLILCGCEGNARVIVQRPAWNGEWKEDYVQINKPKVEDFIKDSDGLWYNLKYQVTYKGKKVTFTDPKDYKAEFSTRYGERKVDEIHHTKSTTMTHYLMVDKPRELDVIVAKFKEKTRLCIEYKKGEFREGDYHVPRYFDLETKEIVGLPSPCSADSDTIYLVPQLLPVKEQSKEYQRVIELQKKYPDPER